MKKVNKIVAVLLSVLMAFSFAGCSGLSDVETKFNEVLGSVEGWVDSMLGNESEEEPPEEEEEEQEEKEIGKYLQSKATSAGRVTLDKESDCPADFVLEVAGDEPIKILQLTDTQMIDETQVRKGNGAVSTRYADHDNCIYDIVRQTVEATDPDLILITGDYVYGDYDDNGSLFREQTDFFDSLGIYWAPIYGNHDNDSDSEYAVWMDEDYPDWYARKQCQYFEQAEYCLFRTRAQISGYSNFSIAIEQGGEIVRSIVMFDTHGSLQTTQGITSAQMNWYKDTVKAINDYAGKTVKQFIGIHVPMHVFKVALQEKYGELGYNDSPTNFTIPENADGDCGALIDQGMSGHDKDLSQFNVFKEKGADAILAGHIHKVNTIVLYQGVRLVMGTKSSRYDKYNEEQLGGTIFTVTGEEYTVEHYYYTEATAE